MKYWEYMKASTDSEGSYKDGTMMPDEGAQDTPMTNEIFISPDIVVNGHSSVNDRPDYMSYHAEDNKSAGRDHSQTKDLNEEFGKTGAFDEITAASEALPLEEGYTKDYGQKLADMNVDGMPWFEDMPDQEEMLARLSEPQLNARETRKLMFSSLFAALAVAGVFILALFLFLMFCIHVWF